MSQPTDKPWSMIEDADTEPVAAQEEAVSNVSLVPHPIPPADRPPTRHPSPSHRNPAAWTFACLITSIVSSLAACGGAIASDAKSRVWLPAAIAAAASILGVCWLRSTGNLGPVLRGGRRFKAAANAEQESNLEPEVDLQSSWQAVEAQTAEIQKRLETVLEEHAQMSLELSLAASRKRQALAILDAIQDPLVVVDAFDQLLLANPAAEQLLDFDRTQANRKPITDFIQDERLRAILLHAREADSRASRRRIEHEIKSRFFALTIVPLASESGSGRHGIVTLFRDITRERESARHKSEFVAQAAHELRTPLSAIRAYVEMLVDGEAGDEKTKGEYYQIIQSSATRLGRMIDNILDISRIEAGTVRINKEPVAISMIAKEAVDTLRPQAEQKNLTLTADLAPVVDRVLADRDLLQQALLNLISNAIKYTPTGGWVQLRMATLSDARKVRIEVCDSGVGVPAEDLPRMFEKFFRVEANKNLATGTGLGLNLVKQIVEVVHGGEISVASETGKGSTFAISLPLYNGE